MTHFEATVVSLSFVSVILIPVLILLFRISTKWTKTEDKLDAIAKDMDDLVRDKDKVHMELASQMREDRTVTDRRLRWLEENLWKYGIRSGQQHS